MKTVLKMLAICMMAGGLGVQSVYAEPLVIQEQGSFSAGGTIITAPGTFDAKKPLDSAGQTYHGDHASVFYQIPENPHKYPIVMLHGAGQSSRTWESTPDGREGFQNIFLRRGFSTYIVDQPRRGDAGRTTVEGTVTPKPDEQMWFNQFRVGVWPDYFKGVQFSHDKEALNQYFRQMTPNTGPFDVNVISDAMSAVVDKSGPAILFTHSQGGGPGWYTAMKNNKVKAIVAFEPGSGFVFPEKELPAPMPSAFDTLKGEPVPMEQFMALTKIPILIIYGDNIPDKPVAMPAQDSWRVRLAMARKWRDVVNNVRIALMTTIGVTERLSSWNQRTEVHDWKRRSERLVRACGHIYTIVRPGWFDYNNDDEHRIVMLQGDRRHAGTPEDGVISREQIAQVLVTALSNDAAKNKTFELVAERGEAQQDLTLLFAELRNDNPQKNDGVFDIDNMPLTEEPECVINDLNLYSKNSKI